MAESKPQKPKPIFSEEAAAWVLFALLGCIYLTMFSIVASLFLLVPVAKNEPTTVNLTWFLVWLVAGPICGWIILVTYKIGPAMEFTQMARPSLGIATFAHEATRWRAFVLGLVLGCVVGFWAPDLLLVPDGNLKVGSVIYRISASGLCGAVATSATLDTSLWSMRHLARIFKWGNRVMVSRPPD